MEPQPLYADNANPVAAREYAGCFTVNQVRQLLGQDCGTGTPKRINLAGSEGRKVTQKNHYLPDCICAKIHVQCRLRGIESSDEEKEMATLQYKENVHITLDQLREAGHSGCWFCSVLYGGINDMPSWDPTMHPPDKLNIVLERGEFGLQVRMPKEPSLKFSIDSDKGTMDTSNLITLYSQLRDMYSSFKILLLRILLTLRCASNQTRAYICRSSHANPICLWRVSKLHREPQELLADFDIKFIHAYTTCPDQGSQWKIYDQTC